MSLTPTNDLILQKMAAKDRKVNYKKLALGGVGLLGGGLALRYALKGMYPRKAVANTTKVVTTKPLVETTGGIPKGTGHSIMLDMSDKYVKDQRILRKQRKKKNPLPDLKNYNTRTLEGSAKLAEDLGVPADKVLRSAEDFDKFMRSDKRLVFS
jgi:hypothetical protein